MSCNSSIDIFFILQFDSIAMEEATPAACPKAIQHGSIRSVENPICEPDTATGNKRLSTSLGSITPQGTV